MLTTLLTCPNAHTIHREVFMPTPQTAQTANKKRVIPPPGRKLPAKQARQRVNKQFSKAFQKLAH
jgi:hypothetical protein